MLGASCCENDKLPISYKSSVDSRKIGACPNVNTKVTGNVPNGMSRMIGKLFGITKNISGTLKVVK